LNVLFFNIFYREKNKGLTPPWVTITDFWIGLYS
jgi:hypothetical protein